MYLSTILDDFSRYIISWKLCTTMKTSDVTDTLNLALAASGCDQDNVVHKPRLLSDNGASYISGEFKDYIQNNKMSHVRARLIIRKRRVYRALASDIEKPRAARELLLTRGYQVTD